MTPDWQRPNPFTAPAPPPVAWGTFQRTVYATPDGIPMYLFRKGQRARWYDDRGRLESEHPNVAPAIAYALSRRWRSL